MLVHIRTPPSRAPFVVVLLLFPAQYGIEGFRQRHGPPGKSEKKAPQSHEPFAQFARGLQEWKSGKKVMQEWKSEKEAPQSHEPFAQFARDWMVGKASPQEQMEQPPAELHMQQVQPLQLPEAVGHVDGYVRLLKIAQEAGHGVAKLVAAAEHSRWPSPGELWAVLFIFMCCANYSKVLVMDIFRGTRVKDLLHSRTDLIGKFNKAQAEMMAELEHLEASVAIRAEQDFRLRSQALQSFLEDVAAASKAGRLAGIEEDKASLVRIFRRFLRLWLKVFEACCLEPLAAPRKVLEETELSNCSRISQLSRLVGGRMADCPVRFVSETWDCVIGSQHNWSTCACYGGSTKRMLSWNGYAKFQIGVQRQNCVTEIPKGWPIDISLGCFTVEFFSWGHIRLLIAIALGAGLFGLMIAVSQVLIAAGVAVTEVVLLVVLSFAGTISSRCQLKAHIENLSLQRQDAEDKRREIQEKCAMASAAANLWQYRTIPHLALFEEVSGQFREIDDDRKVSFLKDAAKMMESVDSGLGELWMWAGRHAVAEDTLKTVGGELRGASDAVKDNRSKEDGASQTLQRLDKVRTCLAVTMARGTPRGGVVTSCLRMESTTSGRGLHLVPTATYS